MHGGGADNFTVLTNYLRGAGSCQEVKVENTTENVVFEVLSGLFGVVDHDIHAVRVEEEDGVRTALALLEVNRVRAVKIRSSRNRVTISVPKGSDVVGRVEPEVIGMLALKGLLVVILAEGRGSRCFAYRDHTDMGHRATTCGDAGTATRR